MDLLASASSDRAPAERGSKIEGASMFKWAVAPRQALTERLAALPFAPPAN